MITVVNSFYGEWRHHRKGHGRITIFYRVVAATRHPSRPLVPRGSMAEVAAADAKGNGLWVESFAGYKRSSEPFTDRPIPTPALLWTIAEPDDDLLNTAALVAYGRFPLWAFADWLEERRDHYLPLVTKFGCAPVGLANVDIWDGVLSEMRYVAGVRKKR